MHPLLVTAEVRKGKPMPDLIRTRQQARVEGCNKALYGKATLKTLRKEL
jgi:hypothetical protein